MKTLRWASAPLGALLIVTTAQPATAAHTGASQAASSATQAPMKKASRSYGDGPVVLDGQSARISFRGTKGDVVHLDTGRTDGLEGSKTRLHSGNRRVAATWKYYWRLPRSGRFTFVFRAAAGDDPGRRLQLEKLRIAETELDAKPVAARKQPRGYLNAVSFSMREGERALLTSRDFRHTLLAPAGNSERLVGHNLQLEVGRQVHTTIGDLGTDDLAAGAVIVVSKGSRSTRVTRSVVEPISTDGTAVEFTSDNKPREYVFTFEAAEGDVVIPEFHGTTRWSRVLQPPDAVSQEEAPLSGTYWLDRSGTFRYSVITNGRAGATTRLSLTKALRGPDVQDLDTPITLANTKPGQYVAVRLPTYPTPSPIGLTASGPTFTATDGSVPTWSVHLEPSSPYYCLTDPDAPLGCGEYYPLTVDQDRLSNAYPAVYGFTGDVLVLAVPPTVSGSVTITLQKRPPLG